MSHGGYGGHVVDHLVLARESLAEQTLQTAVTILVLIIIEIVPTHLVDDDSDYKTRTFHLCPCCKSHEAHKD